MSLVMKPSGVVHKKAYWNPPLTLNLHLMRLKVLPLLETSVMGSGEREALVANLQKVRPTVCLFVRICSQTLVST